MYCTVGTSYKMGSNGAACEIGKKREGGGCCLRLAARQPSVFWGKTETIHAKANKNKLCSKTCCRGFAIKTTSFYCTTVKGDPSSF